MLTRNATWPGPNHGAIIPPRPKDDGQALLAEVETFAWRHRLAPSAVCRRATGNGNLYDRLLEGLNPRTVTVNKVRRFMRDFEERADG